MSRALSLAGFQLTLIGRLWVIPEALKQAGVPHFPIYNLRHAFCTRLSWVAPDAIIERAMHHTSPQTKRRYQLSMVEQVREAMEKANQRVYGERVTIH
jgi:integrase